MLTFVFNLSQMMTSVSPVRVKTAANVTWMAALTLVNVKETGKDIAVKVSDITAELEVEQR